MASLGSLVIELAANTARLQSDMGKAVGIIESGARKIKGAFAALGIAGGGGVIATLLGDTIKKGIALGDELNKLSIKSGIGAKAISELGYAAKLADVDMTSLATAIKKMQVSISEAGSGLKAPKEAFAALGITLEQIQRLKPEDQFSLIGDRISSLRNPADRSRAAVELFGKAGADLLPLFEQGAAGIAKARAEAERLGYSFTGDQLKKLSEADDSIKRLSASWEAFGTVLATKVAGPLSKILDDLSNGKAIDRAKRLAISPIYGVVSTYKEVFGEKSPFEQMQENLHPELGGRGRPTIAPGFKNIADDEAARAAAKAAAKKDQQYQEKLNDQYRDMVADLNQDIDRMADDRLEKDMERQRQRMDEVDEFYKSVRERENQLAVYREQQAQKTADAAKAFFNNAFDAMEENGKLSFKRLMKFIIAELVQSGINKLIDQLFTRSSSGSNSGFINFVGSLFTARASGGPVAAGQGYLVGEKGPEIFRPNVSGAIIPNSNIGGSIVVSPHYNIDARGASVDLVKALPNILKQNNESLKNDLISGIRRRKYPIGLPA